MKSMPFPQQRVSFEFENEAEQDTALPSAHDVRARREFRHVIDGLG
jgi:hypothetical protein